MGPEPAVIPLEPWTVYGWFAFGAEACGPTVDVLDIGMLPPAGRYAGSLELEDDHLAVVFTVPPRSPVAGTKHRRLRVEVAPSLALPSECQVALTVRGLLP